MDKHVESDEDIDMLDQPQVILNLPEIEIEAQHPDRRPPSPDVMDGSHPPMNEEIAVVAASVEGNEVINISDVESYGFEHLLIGDSTDEDNDKDNEGVTQGVEMPSALERCAIEVDAPSAAATKAGPASTPAGDEFYNAIGHLVQMRSS